MFVNVSNRALEYLDGVGDDGEGPREHDQEEVCGDEDEGSPDVGPGDVPEGLRHGQAVTLLLLGFLYLDDLLTDIFRGSSK